MTQVQADRYVVVSADSHVGPKLEEYLEYCPKRYVEELDDQLQRVIAQRRSGFAATAAQATNYRDLDPRFLAAAEASAAVAGAFDPGARHRAMDLDGVAADVIFHGTHSWEPMPLIGDGLFGIIPGTSSADRDAAGYHMYNQWLADFISGSPERHAGIAYVSLLDIDGAVAELEWARGAGLRGVNFPAPRRDLPDFTSPRYDHFFAACASLGMPLSTHSGGGDRWTYEDGVVNSAIQCIEVPYVARRGLWQLVLSGVFDRFPDLKFVLTEAYGRWIPETVGDMDLAYLDPMNPGIRRKIRHLPSEYWMSNCYVGASFMSHDEAGSYPARGTSRMMWGSDYPHCEGTHPYTRLAMRTTFAGISADAVRSMIGLTAAEAYGMDLARLGAIADRIGPTVEELMTGTNERPGPEYMGRGFRPNTDWPAGAGR
jgi:predicted TIM-barrel fold metal-dependent hydrolase